MSRCCIYKQFNIEWSFKGHLEPLEAMTLHISIFLAVSFLIVSEKLLSYLQAGKKDKIFQKYTIADFILLYWSIESMMKRAQGYDLAVSDAHIKIKKYRNPYK